MAPGRQRRAASRCLAGVALIALLAGCQAGAGRPQVSATAGAAPDASAELPGSVPEPGTIPPWAERDLQAALAAEAEAEEVAADAGPDDEAEKTGLEKQAEAMAETRVRAAVSTRPIDLPQGQSWEVFARRQLAAGRTGLALRAYERAIAERDADPLVLAGAGIAAMGEGQFALAERYLSSALIAAPQDPAINLAMGRLLMRQGRLEPARNYFRTAFLVTSGQNELAVASLEEVDRRIAARRALYLPTLDRESAVNLSTLRTGPSTYKLATPATGAEARTEGVLGVVVPPDAAIRDETDTEAVNDVPEGGSAPSTGSTEASPNGTVTLGDDAGADPESDSETDSGTDSGDDIDAVRDATGTGDGADATVADADGEEGSATAQP